MSALNPPKLTIQFPVGTPFDDIRHHVTQLNKLVHTPQPTNIQLHGRYTAVFNESTTNNQNILMAIPLYFEVQNDVALTREDRENGDIHVTVGKRRDEYTL